MRALAVPALALGLLAGCEVTPKPERGLDPVPEGHGRLDALQRIADRLLADDLALPSNALPMDAPVSFPPEWDIRRFDWMQCNASVRQPMLRNDGEGPGIIGPALSEAERRALIEYLKSATHEDYPVRVIDRPRRAPCEDDPGRASRSLNARPRSRGTAARAACRR